MFRCFGYIGAMVRRFFSTIGDITLFTGAIIKGILLAHRQEFRVSFSVIMRQVYFTGFEALPSLTLVSLTLGVIVIIQSLTQLIDVGARNLIGIILVITIIRELGPLFTAMVVISRSGTAIAAELGTNRVMGEIELLEGMGIDLFQFTIIPRVLGCIIAMICLTIYFDVIALVGGFTVAKLKLVMPFQLYFRYIFEALTLTDVYIGLSKSFLFGGVIAILCCYYGLRVHRSATEIPQMARMGVMYSMFLVLFSSSVISAIVYLL